MILSGLLLAACFIPAAGGGLSTTHGPGLTSHVSDPDRNFLFATSSGNGMTAECACLDVTAVKGNAITFTRNLVAWCTKADFSLVECAANKPRVMVDKGVPAYNGLLIEARAKTNLVLHNRDLSDAAWTKSSMTCTKTAAGADKVANSASTCVATGSNGTVAQGFTVSSALRNSSLYIRRLAGTGAVSVSRDNGSTYVDVSASLSSTIYKRVVSLEEIGCQYGGCIVVSSMQAVAANPTIIVKLATSGDSVDIDLVQDEADAFPTSPITTAASSVQRPAETAAATVTAFNPTAMGYEARHSGWQTAGAAAFAMEVYKDATNRATPYDIQISGNGGVPSLGGTNCFWFATSNQSGVISVPFQPAFGPVPVTCTNDGVNITAGTNGLTNATAATTLPFTGATQVYLGGGPGMAGGVGQAMLISNVCADATACPIGINRAPNAVAWDGDSIIAGNNVGTLGVNVAGNLQELIGRPVYNYALAGDNIAGCAARYTAGIRGRGIRTLVWSCGTNDSPNGTSAPTRAVLWAAIKAVLDDAIRLKLRLIVTSILPRGGGVGYTTNIRDSILSWNASAAAYCASNPCTYVDSYATFGGEGGDPNVMQLIYDVGDGVHINTVGTALYATLIAAANP